MTDTAPHLTSFDQALTSLPDGPLTEQGLREHVFPLFSRVLKRDGIYLANHSLGRPPDRTAEDVRTAIDLWYSDMDAAWSSWMAEHELFRTNMARLIGCARPDAVIPKTSAAQGLRAALNALPGRQPVVLSTRGEFDSIHHVLSAYHKKARIDLRLVEPSGTAIVAALQSDPSPDLVVFSQVMFTTGKVLQDAAAVVSLARAAGFVVEERVPVFAGVSVLIVARKPAV